MEITKWIEALFQPIGLLWVIHVAAAIRFFAGKRWGPAFFCVGLAAAISLVGSTSFPSRLLASLERPYVVENWESLPKADAVLMLGGTVSPSRHDPLGFHLGSHADRFVAAIELIRRGKADTLILGGGGRRGDSEEERWREAALLERWCDAWGLKPDQLLRLEVAANTYEEAVQVRDLAKQKEWNRILLVSSASHLRRSEAIFRQFEIDVVAVGCDFEGISALDYPPPFNPVPKPYGFRHLELFLHEWVGWYYYRLRGWVEGQ